MISLIIVSKPGTTKSKINLSRITIEDQLTKFKI